MNCRWWDICLKNSLGIQSSPLLQAGDLHQHHNRLGSGLDASSENHQWLHWSYSSFTCCIGGQKIGILDNNIYIYSYIYIYIYISFIYICIFLSDSAAGKYGEKATL